MELLLPSFIKHLLIAQVMFLIIYCLGHLLVFRQSGGTHRNGYFFKKIAWGFITLVTVFALYFTQGQSVYLISGVLLAAAVVYHFMNDFKWHNIIQWHRLQNIEYRELIISMMLLSLLYAFTYYYLVHFPEGGTVPDYIFYANAAHFIKTTGVENPINSLSIYAQETGPYHYHYTQIYLTLIVSTLFSIKYYHALILIVFSLIQLMMILGAHALLTNFGFFQRNSIVKWSFSLLILLVIPITLTTERILPISLVDFENFFDYPKLGEIYILLILGLNYFFEEKYFHSLISALLIIPFFSTIAPGVLSGLFILAILICFTWNKSRPRSAILSIALILIVFFLFWGFYYFLSSPGNIGNVISFKNEINGLLTWESIEWVINRNIKLALSIIPTFFILFVVYKTLYYKIKTLIFPLKRKETLVILVFIVTGYFFSTVTAALFRNINHDTGQVYANFISPLIIIVLFILIAFSVDRIQNQSLKAITTIILLGMFLLNSIYYSKGMFFIGSNYFSPDRKAFQEKVFSRNIKTDRIAIIKHYPSETNLISPHSYLHYFSYPFGEMVHLNGYYAPDNISIMDIGKVAFDDLKTVHGIDFDYRDESAFAFFVNDQKQNGTFLNLERSKADYIISENIPYMIVERGSIIPDELKNLTKNKIASEDYIFIEFH